MKSRLTAAALGVLAVSLTALPAEAQSAESVSATYQKGVASGVSPVTASEMTTCAAYWKIWQKSASNDWEPAFVEDLAPGLKPEAAGQAASFWTDKAKALYLEDDGELTYYESQLPRSAEMASDAYDALMLFMPDPLKIFETLGTCHLPE